MRLTLIAIGRLKAGQEADLAARYLDRLARAGGGVSLEYAKTIELTESRASNSDHRKAEEASEILKVLPKGALLVALDERGKLFSSEEFAETLGRYRDDGHRDIAFVIGGPDGLDPEIRKAADVTLCFGRMTWPHQMVRIMLAEQLYRASTILSGHPYHRS